MADMLKLSCDIDGALKNIKSLQEDQLPFIIARSLTAVAGEAQKAARITVGQVFTTRNDWTVRNIKVKPATKQSLMAEVYTDTANRKTGAPDYMGRQEEGGDKVPVAGHAHLAEPTKYLWQYTPKDRPVPDAFRAKNLLPPFAKIGEAYGGTFTKGSRASGTRRLLGRASMRKVGNGQFVAFLQHTKRGTLCIFVRHGGIGFKAARDAEPWYNLVKSAQVKPRLHMQEAVEEVVRQQFEEIFVTVAKDVGVTLKL